MGIALLTVALFISARMGIYQEVLYKRYGKHPREALYVTVSTEAYRIMSDEPRQCTKNQLSITINSNEDKCRFSVYHLFLFVPLIDKWTNRWK